MAFRGTSSKLIEYVGKVSLEHITDQTYMRNVRAFCEKIEREVSISPTILASSDTDASTESNRPEGRDQVRKDSLSEPTKSK
jgi:hypothetical protein